MLKGLKISLLCLGIAFTAWLLAIPEAKAANATRPNLVNVNIPGTLDIDSLVYEFRSPLERLVLGLFDNFIVQKNAGRWQFLASQEMDCSFNKAPARSVLSAIDYFLNKKELGPSQFETVERIHYRDCSGNINLTEMIVRRGSNPSIPSDSDFRRGKRRLNLDPGTTFSSYQLTNGRNEEIISVQSSNEGEGMLEMVRLFSQDFMKSILQWDSGRLYKRYTFYPFKFEYRMPYYNSTVEREIPVGSIEAWQIATTTSAGPDQIVNYRSTADGFISRQQFQFKLQENAVEKGLTRIRNIIDYHMYYFPKAQFSVGRIQQNRFKEELELAQIQLLNNTDINLVRNFVRKALEAIEAGLLRIEDNRPAE